MFKGFLMENAHRENVKNLFRWWNGHVFSFETVPGTARKDNDSDGFDSGMDEAEAALDSDGGFSDEELGGENVGDGRYHWPGQADPDDLQVSTNFAQLTISERSVAPSDPVAAPVHVIVVPWVHEPTSVHSAGVVTSFAQ